MNWFNELLPTWKSKLTAVALVLLLCVVLVFVLALPQPNENEFSTETSNSTIKHWASEQADCYILVDEATKKPITMSCVAKKPE